MAGRGESQPVRRAPGMLPLNPSVAFLTKATVIGEEVEVVELRGSEIGVGVGAVCRYKGKDYRIDINSLGWLKQKPKASSGSRRTRRGAPAGSDGPPRTMRARGANGNSLGQHDRPGACLAFG